MSVTSHRDDGLHPCRAIANSVVLTCVLLAAGYMVAGRLSSAVSVSHGIVTLVIFGAEGLALAAGLTYGSRVWPGVFLGQLVLALSQDVGLAASLGVSAINASEMVLGVCLARRWGLNRSLERLRDLLLLAGLITFILQPFSATLGNLVLWLSGTVPLAGLPESWATWWFGNVVGQLIVAPVLLGWKFSSWRQPRPLNTGILTAAAVAITFGAMTSLPIDKLAIAFTLCSPFQVVVSAKRGAAIGALISLAMAATALTLTHHGMGTFATADGVRILDLNFFILANLLGGLVVACLIEERHAAEDALRKMALYDALTGLPNRRLLETRLEAMHAHARRRGVSIAVAFVDIDDFKQVNDTFGHAAGDALLTQLAQRLTDALRTSDTVGRMGGDEFVLIADDVKGQEQVDLLMARLVATTSYPFRLDAGGNHRDKRRCGHRPLRQPTVGRRVSTPGGCRHVSRKVRG